MRSALASLALLLSSCDAATDQSETFTLYRNSPFDPSMRLHIATFDADDHDDYNERMCDLTAGLFKNHTLPGQSLPITYWCEPGRFRPNR